MSKKGEEAERRDEPQRPDLPRARVTTSSTTTGESTAAGTNRRIELAIAGLTLLAASIAAYLLV